MDWWFWIFLWVAVAALSLLFVGFLAVWIFRSFMKTLQEFETAAGKLEAAFGSAPAVESGEGTPFEPAIFLDPAVARERYLDGKSVRREARRERRVARRSARGQRQSLRDVKFS
ncbi:hypothetical protein D477_003678 [Arthrobacter crystallopoietes BAB-32]|uniref:Uncharacterized protein n=1 Tax=Arthrobacter crystallopoietes BAB-32 TaxID=1246476 RepID=N1V6F4_9MICC|nr:hypothetical protein [Arthrobacter crystallopoietes]EMY35604.1 hypothetical protein D477_003678 [Arthrobacter crystallopoietes BAB-32]